MSVREDLIDQIQTLIIELGLNTNPSAGFTAISPDRKYRTISLGWARYLDAEVRVYGPRFFIYRDSRGRSATLKSWDELDHYLRIEIAKG